MAFLSKLIVAATALSFAAARPLAVRDATSVVTETEYTTVNVPVTLWVDEHGKPLSTVAQGGIFAVSATPIANSPIAESPKAIQASASPSTPPPAPAVPTTTAAPQAPQAQAQAYTPPAPAPSPSTPTSAAAAPTNKPQSGQTSSTGSTCQGSDNACTGDITHWDGGLGACGWNVDTTSDMQIALPVGLMGAQSNGNPYCGKSLTIKNPTTGSTIQATVGDKCMGCTSYSIDLTSKLFDAIGGGCDGRCSGFEWWFN